MQIFYGKELVRKERDSKNDRSVIFYSPQLMLLSKTKHKFIPLTNKGRLYLWGEVYAIISDNGEYIACGSEKNKEEKLRQLFSKQKLDEVIIKVEGNYVGCLLKANGEVEIFGNIFNCRDVFYSLLKDGVVASLDLQAVVSRQKIIYDQVALVNLLSIYGMHSPKKHTIYKGVRRLGVGERLIFKDGKVSIEKIPFVSRKIKNYGPLELEKYESLLTEAVKIRGSKSCNWVYLSSGWDSTTLLALLIKIFGRSRVKAVTGKLEYSTRNREPNRFEIQRAKNFANYFSVDFQVVPIDYTREEAVKCWEEIKPFLKRNHIYADNSYNFYSLAKSVSFKSCKHDALFSGEISDGAHNLGFAQFTTILEHPVLEFREYSDKMAAYLFGPTFFKSVVNGTYLKDTVYRILRNRLSGHLFEDNRKLSEFQRKAKLVASFFLRGNRFPFISLKNQKNITPKGAELYEAEMMESYLSDCIKDIQPDTIYSWILYLYNSFHWQGSTVKSISESARFFNLDMKLPFWDSRLQEFLSEMPENWGRGLELRPTKYPLKWLIENKIDYPKHLQTGPHSYLYDVNPNFSLEAEILFGSALKRKFQDILKDYPFEMIMDKEYFNVNYYRKLVKDYVAGVESSGQDLSNLYNLIWLCWIGWY